MIKDAQTGLEWLLGPNLPTDYQQAVDFVKTCQVAGGGWRLPTRQELAGLYAQGQGPRKLNAAFYTTGSWVWAEAKDEASWWAFSLQDGSQAAHDQYAYIGDHRVFAVRATKN